MTAPIVDIEIEEHLPIEQRKLMARMPRYEPKIKDHSTIVEFIRCDRAYFYKFVLARVPKEDVVFFAWGQAYHTFRYVLERDYGYGDNAPPKYDEQRAAIAVGNAIAKGLEHWKKYGKDQPVGTKYDFMTQHRLLMSFKHAFAHWKKEKEQGRIKVIAIEQAFNIRLPDGTYRSGRADQIVKWNGRTWGRDFKATTKEREWFERGLEPNDQFTGYTYCEGKLVGEVVQGQIVELMHNKKETKTKSGGPEIIELTTSRTPYQLQKWEEEIQHINRQLELNRKEDVWPMKAVSCAWCPYHSVCTKPSEGAMMAQLEAMYTLRIWDNTKVGVET